MNSARLRKQRLRDALAGFDAATIATTHQFCQLVLKSLGVAGDTAANVTLLESLDELVAEIVDDLYLAHFGQERDDPVLQYGAALRLAREVVNNPAAELRPRDPEARFVGRGPCRLRERSSGRAGNPQAAARRPRLRRPAEPTGRRAGHRRLPRPGAHAPALADRHGRRIPGHRPSPMAGDRPRVQRALHGDPDRRPEAGHLRVPRRRHRDVSGGGQDGRRAEDAGHQLAQRRRAARAAAGGAARRPTR